MKTPEHPIFLESVKYIRSKLGFTGLDKTHQTILERIIHSSGDLSLHSYLRFSPGACDAAVNALQNGANIMTDTYMAKSAINPMAKRTLNTDVQCILSMAPAYVDTTLTTRSAVGMRNIWLDVEEKDNFLNPPLVVIGSSPTALMSLLDLVDEGYKIPSLISKFFFSLFFNNSGLTPTS